MSRFVRSRKIIFHSVTALGMLLCWPALNAVAQQSGDGGQDKNLDIRSSVGDLHVGNDASARDTGLPLYPGSRLRHDDQDKNKDNANFGILTSAFGIKLVVVNYDSDDSPDKLIAYYRKKLEKYGKVLECHSNEGGGDVHINADNHDSDSKELKCDGDNNGNHVELKVGTEENQHVVSIKPESKGSSFALVYLYTRGKEGSI